MVKKIVLVFLIMCSISRATDGPECNPSILSTNDCDHFDILDPNHALHVVGGALVTMVFIQVLRKVGVKKTESIIIGGLMNYVLFTQKEFFHDAFASAGNNRGNLLGSGLGMLITISLF